MTDVLPVICVTKFNTLWLCKTQSLWLVILNIFCHLWQAKMLWLLRVLPLRSPPPKYIPIQFYVYQSVFLTPILYFLRQLIYTLTYYSLKWPQMASSAFYIFKLFRGNAPGPPRPHLNRDTWRKHSSHIFSRFQQSCLDAPCQENTGRGIVISYIIVLINITESLKIYYQLIIR